MWNTVLRKESISVTFAAQSVTFAAQTVTPRPEV
jgi:hypothetical protein